MQTRWIQIKGATGKKNGKKFMVKLEQGFFESINRKHHFLGMVFHHYRMTRFGGLGEGSAVSRGEGEMEWELAACPAHPLERDLNVHYTRIHLKTGLWACKCGAAGGSVEFLAGMEGIPRECAALVIYYRYEPAWKYY